MTGRPAHPRPFPFAPLETAGSSDKEIGEWLGITPRTIRRLRVSGITVDEADRFAVRLGLHPSALWPEWFDDEPVPEEVSS